VTDSAILDLVAQHRTAAQHRYRWLWQPDPAPYLMQIDNLADLLSLGDVTAANDAGADLKAAYRSIDAHLDQGINGANRDLIDWTGDSADKFAVYLNQVQEAVGSYKDILHDYLQIQSGYAALVQGVINDASALVNKAIDAQTDVSVPTWEVVLTAIAAVSAGIGAVISGPVGWAIVTSTVAGVASAGSVIISNSDPASTAQSLADGLQGLLNDVNDQLDRFDKAVVELRGYLDSNGPLPAINPRLPGFITAPSFEPSLFHLSNEPAGIESGVSKGQLVKPPQPDGVPQSSISNRLAGG